MSMYILIRVEDDTMRQNILEYIRYANVDAPNIISIGDAESIYYAVDYFQEDLSRITDMVIIGPPDDEE